MATLNINRDVTDVFYRYKMPKIVAKVEGRGNGIKTVIVNMSDVAKSLERPPTYPTKFFGTELGAQTTSDLKTDRYIVNGSHTSDKLQEILDVFIKKYVLCKSCENPETKLSVAKKDGVIEQVCAACGHRGTIDTTHRFSSYVLKNPPDDDGTQEKDDGKGGKPKKKGKRGKGKEDSPTKEEEEDTMAAVVDEEEAPVPQAEPVIESGLSGWGEDASEAAVEQRLEQISDVMRKTVISDRSEPERYDMFFRFVKHHRDEGTILHSIKAVVDKADELDMRQKAVLALAELLYTEKLYAEVSTYRPLFLQFTYENKKAQKYLLGAFEQIVGKLHPVQLMPCIPQLLQLFFNEDLIEEAVFFEWKPSSKYVSRDISKKIAAAAAPFVTWLKEADCDEDDGEEETDEDDDVEVDFANTGQQGLVEAKTEPVKAVSAGGGEEIDIDDI